MKKTMIFKWLLLLCMFVGQVQATVIDTTGGIFGGVSPFGEPDTATYGQTFTVDGSDTVLDQFSFRFDDVLNPDVVDFAAYIYGWDGSKAVGPELYASAMLSSSNNGGADGFEVFTFSTSGLTLTSGLQYVAFLSASQFFDDEIGTSSWELSSDDIYSGGDFVFFNHGSDFGQLFTNSWNSVAQRDTWFIAEFSATAVSEPSTFILFALSLMVLGFYRIKA